MGAYMKNPEISVIMGIYNCADTLSEAIESVLGQTMSEWELIMCDDGSSDATSEVAEFYIKKYPERMVLLKNKENRGLNYTLNRCLKWQQESILQEWMEMIFVCQNDLRLSMKY